MEENIMPVMKNILFATDLSPNSSSYAFSYAVDMAQSHNASIVILHVVEKQHNMSYAGSNVEAVMRDARADEQKKSREEIKKDIEMFCKKVGEQIGLPCPEMISKILVPIGSPVEEILKAAEEESCDVLVLGVHKKGFLLNALLGHVASSVLEKSKKPVFIIPLPSEKAYAEQIHI
jgi:nucleotide-binding universal stress UspA family protein